MKAAAPMAATAIAALLFSCVSVLFAFVIGSSGVSSSGAGPFSCVASLCIGFEGWLFGGFIFDGPPAISFSPAFFVLLFTSSLTPSFHAWHSLFELVVVTSYTFHIYYHPRRPQPCPRTHSKVKPHLCLVDSKLVPLN